MILEQKEQTTLIRQDKARIEEISAKMEILFPKFVGNHLIVILSAQKIVDPPSIIRSFLNLSNRHKASHHSFVIVSNQIDLSEVPDDICIVPTLGEAYDIIDMENMERDLGL